MNASASTFPTRTAHGKAHVLENQHRTSVGGRADPARRAGLGILPHLQGPVVAGYAVCRSVGADPLPLAPCRYNREFRTSSRQRVPQQGSLLLSSPVRCGGLRRPRTPRRTRGGMEGGTAEPWGDVCQAVLPEPARRQGQDAAHAGLQERVRCSASARCCSPVLPRFSFSPCSEELLCHIEDGGALLPSCALLGLGSGEHGGQCHEACPRLLRHI